MATISKRKTAERLGVPYWYLPHFKKHGLKDYSGGHLESDVEAFKKVLKKVPKPAPGPNDLLTKSEACQYTGFTDAELTTYALSKKMLGVEKGVDGFLFTRRGLDLFKADLKLAKVQ